MEVGEINDLLTFYLCFFILFRHVSNTHALCGVTPDQINTAVYSKSTQIFKLPYIGHFSVVTQKKIRHLIKRYCNDLDIKLVFSSFKIGKFLVRKTLSPAGFIRVWFISLLVRAVMPVMSAKPPDIFSHAYVST